MDNLEKPVFTEEEVRILNEYQQAGKYHPYTCPNDGDEKHIHFEFGNKFPALKDNKNIVVAYDSYILVEQAKGIPYPEMEFTQTSLIATQKGWICPCCDYTQSWAHPSMMEKYPEMMSK